jgi:hypothetical protein
MAGWRPGGMGFKGVLTSGMEYPSGLVRVLTDYHGKGKTSSALGMLLRVGGLFPDATQKGLWRHKA